MIPQNKTTNALPGQVIVLAVKAVNGGFVNWYHTEDNANALFDTAVKEGSDVEEVLMFHLDVPDERDVVDVRKRAEAAASGEVQAIRHWTPIVPTK